MSKEQFEMMRESIANQSEGIVTSQPKLSLNTPLKATEIDFRIQSINKGGYATILAYKDARVDINRLNEVLGEQYWKRSHQLLGDRLYCTISIWNKNIQQWVDKQDVGTESYTEKEKGQASDSFKRACFNLGIGIELYDYPIIQIKLNEDEFYMEGDRAKQSFKLNLRDWVWYNEFTDGKLTYLGCRDANSKIRFQWGKPKPKNI